MYRENRVALGTLCARARRKPACATSSSRRANRKSGRVRNAISTADSNVVGGSLSAGVVKSSRSLSGSLGGMPAIAFSFNRAECRRAAGGAGRERKRSGAGRRRCGWGGGVARGGGGGGGR